MSVKKTSALMCCMATAALLAACSSNPTNGYYDSNGQFVPYNPANRSAAIHSPNSGAAVTTVTTSGYDNGYENETVRVVTSYDRAGYYDYNGYYLGLDSGLNVPEDMFPQRGMCRIWFPHRSLTEQPAIESCHHIQQRVPAGAYVVFGGRD